MLTAKEARSLTTDNNEGVQAALEIIKKEALKGNASANIYQGVMEHEDVPLLRELGYYVSWNRACLWWEVSWEEEINDD